MSIVVDVQRQVAALPTDDDFQLWAEAALVAGQRDDAELTIRVVDTAESAELNQQYRHREGPTNVLSFPFEAPAEVELNLLGDLVICAEVVQQQAKAQGKTERAHWAHMVVHGCLHLLGYDHIEAEDANIMETMEIKILQQLGYSDPYQEI